jgi:histidine ammonia-lyase
MDNASLSTAPLLLTPGEVELAALRRVHAGGVQLALDPAARAGLLAAQATVRRIVDAGEVVYGINTGFGKLRTSAWPSCSATSCSRTAPAPARRCRTAWCAWCSPPRP